MDQAVKIFFIPLKKCESVDLSKPLKKYIKSNYGKNDVKMYEGSIEVVQKKRSELGNLQESQESSKTLCAEYAQLCEYMGMHFPIDTGSTKRVKVAFTWRDAFSGKKVSQGCIAFEQAGVLFNLAAVETQIACTETRTTKDSAMLAAKAFQRAAGMFLYIKNTSSPKLTEKVTTDLSDECLELLASLNVANAQQCVLERAVKTKMKKENLAKLAISTSSKFSDVAKRMRASTIKECFNSSWTGMADFKTHYYCAFAHLVLGQSLYEKKEIGQCLARLELAQTSLKSAKSCKQGKELRKNLEKLQKTFSAKHNEALEDNRTVYFETVPDSRTLSVIKPFHASKPVPYKLESSVSDPFSSLTPVHVVEAASKYHSELKKKFDSTFPILLKHRQKVRAQLAHHGLPGSVMASDRTVEGFPKDVHTKVAKIQSEGGLRNLKELRASLRGMAQECNKSVKEIMGQLDKEEREDMDSRKRFGVKWKRHPSGNLNSGLRKSLSSAHGKISQAAAADTLIDRKIDENGKYFERFRMTPQQLDRTIPKASGSGGSGGTEEERIASQIRELIGNLESMLVNEESSEGQMRKRKGEEEEEGNRKLCEKLISSGNVFQDVNGMLGEWEKELLLLKDSMGTEDLILKQILDLNSKYLSSKRSSSSKPNKRAEAIQGMFYSINKFQEIMGNVSQGLTFYCTMQDYIKKLKQKVEDFIFSRELQSKDYIENFKKQEELQKKKALEQQRGLLPPQPGQGGGGGRGRGFSQAYQYHPNAPTIQYNTGGRGQQQQQHPPQFQYNVGGGYNPNQQQQYRPPPPQQGQGGYTGPTAPQYNYNPNQNNNNIQGQNFNPQYGNPQGGYNHQIYKKK